MKQVFKISEDELQASCVLWFNHQYPLYYWRFFSIPNGGSRNVVEAVKLKKTGTKSGVWDCFLCVAKNGWCGLWIEFKVGRNRLTENQLEFLQANNNDCQFAECRSLEEFIKVINEYLK